MINEILSIINNSKMHRDQKQLHSLPTISKLLFKFSQKALFTQVLNYLSELNCPDEFSVIKGIYRAVGLCGTFLLLSALQSLSSSPY